MQGRGEERTEKDRPGYAHTRTHIHMNYENEIRKSDDTEVLFYTCIVGEYIRSLCVLFSLVVIE